jgi:hypothetical protein
MITSLVTSQNSRKKKTLDKYDWVVSLGATFDFVAIFLLDGFRVGEYKDGLPWCNLGQLFLEEVWLGSITCVT